MKTLIIILLCAFAASAQTGSLNYNPVKVSLTESTYIALLINPTAKESVTIKEVLDYSLIDLKTFRYYASTFKITPCEKCKFVEVRVTINGVSTDYTFKEFEKLIWPNEL